MKKTVSSLLSLLLCFSLVSSSLIRASAAESNSDNIQIIVDRIKEEIPDAQVLIENDTIYIAVNDPEKIPGYNPKARTTSATSSVGGSYRSFKTTAFATFYPTSQVYMPKGVVDALKLSMAEPSVFEFIVDYVVEGYAVATIVAAVKAEFAYTVAASIVSAIAGFGTAALYWAITNAEYYTLKTVQNQSTTGKVSVVRGYTPEGYQLYYYYPWNDNLCPSFNGYDATWFRGVYDVPQA